MENYQRNVIAAFNIPYLCEEIYFYIVEHDTTKLVSKNDK